MQDALAAKLYRLPGNTWHSLNGWMKRQQEMWCEIGCKSNNQIMSIIKWEAAVFFPRAALGLLIAVLAAAPAVAKTSPMNRGRYLVEVACFCGICHNARDANGQMISGKESASGRVMQLQDVRVVLSNIPPGEFRAVTTNTVSYTHLTLPTICSV